MNALRGAGGDALDRFRAAAALVGVVTALFALVTGSARLGDPDVWWLAVAGNGTLSGLHVPTANAYAFTAPSHPWVMHEWSFGVIYALGARLLGLGFFGLFAVAVGGASLALVFRATLGRPRSAVVALSLSAAAVVLFGVRLFSPRPTGMAIVLALAMATLAFDERFDARRAAIAVALELVWTNAHGSFPLGVVILAIASVSERHDRRVRAYACAAALVVTALNPYGFALHRLVLGYALGRNDVYEVIHRHVLEFRPVWQASELGLEWRHLLRIVLVAGAAACALRSPRYRGRAVLCLGLAVFAATATRHVELAGLLACMLLGPLLDEWVVARAQGRSSAAAVPEVGSSARARIALALAPGMLLGIGANFAARGARTEADWVAPRLGGPAVVELVSDLPPGSNVYAPFLSAGLVLWAGRRQGVRVFYDSRNDCYPADVARTFFQLEHEPPAPEAARATLEGYGTTAALLPEGHPLGAALAGAWEATRAGGWVMWRRP